MRSALSRPVPEEHQDRQGVEERYLRAAFDTMRKDYGSVEAFIREGLEVDDTLRKALRERFLEDDA